MMELTHRQLAVVLLQFLSQQFRILKKLMLAGINRMVSKFFMPSYGERQCVDDLQWLHVHETCTMHNIHYNTPGKQ